MYSKYSFKYVNRIYAVCSNVFTLLFSKTTEDNVLTFSLASMDLGYVAAKRQWFIATVCLLQFKSSLFSDL